MNEPRKPTVMLAATRLLHGLSNILQTSVPRDATTMPMQIDRKSWQDMLEKRIALGHKPDDHVNQEDLKYTGPTMSMW